MLRRDHLGDLTLDRREQALLAAELRADARLRRGARGDELALALVRTDERVLVHGHGSLEAHDLVHDGDVLLRHRLHRLDAVHEIVDARRPENHAEGRLVVARGVDGDEPLHERPLRLLEVRARDVKSNLVHLQVVLDLAQPRRRRLVPVTRALETCVELLDLRGDALRFGPLAVDRRVACCRAGRDGCRSESRNENRRLSLTNSDDALQTSFAAGAPGGAGKSQVPQASRGIGCLQPINVRKSAGILRRYSQNLGRARAHKVAAIPGFCVVRSRPRGEAKDRIRGAVRRRSRRARARRRLGGRSGPARRLPATAGTLARRAHAPRAARAVCARYTPA